MHAMMSSMKEIVASSWLRCEEYKVPPLRERAPTVENYESVIETSGGKSLLELSTPHLKRIAQNLAHTDFSLILTDKNGIILYNDGDLPVLNDLEKLNLWPGGIWSEPAAGTNAMGTALVERKPVVIIGDEHYCSGWQNYSCAGVPITGMNGETLGVIDITSYRRSFHLGALAFSLSAARLIELELRRQESDDLSRLAFAYANLLGRLKSDTLMAFSVRGEMVLSNLDLPEHVRRLWTEQVKPLLQEGASEGDLDLAGDKRAFKTFPIWHGNRRIGTLVQIAHQAFLPSASRRKDQHPGTQLHPAFQRIAGLSPRWNRLLENTQKAALTDSTLLLCGESGTGKELLAHACHLASAKAKAPFIALNCGTLTPELAKSDLFGYAPGAFTGALRDGKKGAFEAADGGTLFLDEIGELPPDIQTMLLRVLQEKAIVRVGEYRPRPVNVRIIAATNRDLETEVRKGRFRRDLYFRLNVIQLTLPPLRERTEDIPLLADRLLSELGAKKRHCSPNVLALFRHYPWPGNVRELRNALEHACVFAKSDVLSLEDLPEHIRKWDFASKPVTGGEKTTPALPAEDFPAEEEMQRQKTEAALREARYNITLAAKILGISRGTVYRRIKRFNLL